MDKISASNSFVFTSLFCGFVSCYFLLTHWHLSEQPFAYKNVTYLTNPININQQNLDILIPHSKKPVPLIVFIHGGGWTSGDKIMNPAVWIWKRGYAVASINYRLAPNARFPAQLNDCVSALKFLRTHACDYNIDPNRIGLFGISAGAHLAAITALSDDVFENKEKVRANCMVKAVCAWSGISDLHTISNQEGAKRGIDTCIEFLLGGQPSKLRKEASEASPVCRIKANQYIPPFFLVHSFDDSMVPFAQSRQIFDCLSRAGADATLVTLHGLDHDFYTKQRLLQSLDFFDKKL